MKAIVMGGNGFIGSHLVVNLVSQGVQVSVLDNMVSGHPRRIHPLASFRHMDIGSIEAAQYIVQNKPDIVFHLAA